MMGQQPRTDSLFYYFRLEDQIPDDHLLKRLSEASGGPPSLLLEQKVRRSQRGLALTDAGKEYLVFCKRALRALREGRELVDTHRASHH